MVDPHFFSKKAVCFFICITLLLWPASHAIAQCLRPCATAFKHPATFEEPQGPSCHRGPFEGTPHPTLNRAKPDSMATRSSGLGSEAI